jgi:Mg-chelatase subunit ChlD
VSRLYDTTSVDAIVEAILSQPAQGFTNIEDALDVGRAELALGDNPQKVGLLITDGVFTAGKDPVARAALFPKLHVLLTEDYVMDAELCQKMARAGRGEIFRVCGYQDLPRRMLEVANRILR